MTGPARGGMHPALNDGEQEVRRMRGGNNILYIIGAVVVVIVVLKVLGLF